MESFWKLVPYIIGGLEQCSYESDDNDDPNKEENDRPVSSDNVHDVYNWRIKEYEPHREQNQKDYHCNERVMHNEVKELQHRSHPPFICNYRYYTIFYSKNKVLNFYVTKLFQNLFDLLKFL